MRLHKLLFESISQNTIIDNIELMLNDYTGTNRFLRYGENYKDKHQGSNRDLAEDFYEQNKDTFYRILTIAEQFAYLGSGTKGTAFDLGGNKILKIEKDTPWDIRFSAGDRSDKAAAALFGGESLANYVPMVYDRGIFTIKGKPINWIILEKFEIPRGSVKDLLNYLIKSLRQKISLNQTLKDLLDVRNYTIDEADIIIAIGIELQLNDKWFKNLVKGMFELKNKGIADFHAGNIGIRRVGPEGYLVFFD